MNNIYIKHCLSFVFYVLVQILLFDNVTFMGFVAPVIYLLFILSLPFNTPKWILVLLGFTMGFVIDCFTGFLGMHAFALLVMSFVRNAVIKFIPYYGERDENLQPIVYDMKLRWYLKYIVYLTLIHQFTYYFVDMLTLRHLGRLLMVVLGNTFFSVLCMLIVQYLFYKPSKKGY